MISHILIVGGGISGLTASIALARELEKTTPNLQITVYESRKEQLPGEGGAISLTPVAQHYLDELGVLCELKQMGNLAGIEIDSIDLFSLRSGNPLGSLQFADEKGTGYGGYRCRRVLRSALSAAMLAVATKHHPSISVCYGKKLVQVQTDTTQPATLHFADGTTATGDLVLGCDGVHSAVRTLLVDPGNVSEYTGVSFVQSLVTSEKVLKELPPNFNQTGTALHINRHGSLLASFCDAEQKQLFVAAIMRVTDKMARQHQAVSAGGTPNTSVASESIQLSLRCLVQAKFGVSPCSWIRGLLDKTDDWMLYPVYQVRQSGPWFVERALLLGDSAHAMPPREESAAFAIEDAVIFAQILSRSRDQPLCHVFAEYESVRRCLIDKAFDASRKLWQSNIDNNLFPTNFRDLMSPVRLSPTYVSEQGGGGLGKKSAFPGAPTYESMSDLSVYALTSAGWGAFQQD